MHICFLCNEYPPSQHGGVGTAVQTLARGLMERGHQVTVVGLYSLYGDEEDDDRGVRVVRLARSRIPKTGFIVNGARLRRALYEINGRCPIDVLEGPESSLATVPSDFPAHKVIRMNGGHHFFSVELGEKPKPWRSWLERRSFDRADSICAVSRYVAEAIAGQVTGEEALASANSEIRALMVREGVLE